MPPADRSRPRRQELEPADVDDIIAINLQRAIQAAIDLAAHVAADEGYGVTDTTAGVFTLLEQRGVIDGGLAGRLRKMVGFRNIAIHEYRSVDPEIVEAILEKHLGDLRELGARVVQVFWLSEGT
ncbi:MAG TPA: DUF86 domain-containing protein [Thermoanaerobaculia bacterium]|nr:DUF86 domain-containing protein [Thermoanaerobaculia bacterium]